MPFLLAASAHVVLRDLAVVLVVAAVTTVLFQRLRQPVVLGYLVAGILVGPHTPGATVHDLDTIRALSELGLVLVLFSVGLEFSVGRMLQLGARPAFAAALESSAMLWLGFLAARALGMDARAGLFVGASVAISSTVLIQRAFQESAADPRLRELVLGILVYEDLVGVLLLAGLSALALGADVGTALVSGTGVSLLLFLLLAVGLGRFAITPALRRVVALRNSETLVVACLGLCFALSLIADRMGLSTALGAFLAGSLVAESGHGDLVHRRTKPIADVFAAIFFVSVGMLVDPSDLALHGGKVALLVGVVLVGKIAGTGLGAFLVGEERTTALRAGVCMAQVGEFSFLFAALGISTGAAPAWLAGVMVGVSAATAFLTPYLVGRAARIARRIDHALPQRLRTFAALYTAWLGDVRAAGRERAEWRAARRAGLLVLLDTVVLAGLCVVAATLWDRLAVLIHQRAGLAPALARAGVLAALVLLAAPLALGIVRNSRRLAASLSEAAMPGSPGRRLDPAAAPRRALLVGLQLSVLVVAVLALLAATEPFLPPFATPAVLLLALVPISWALWRSAGDLQGHVRAGTAVIADALLRDRAAGRSTSAGDVQQLLPGLGEITFVDVDAGSAAAGRSLHDLDLHGRHGVLVAAIARGERSIESPGDAERIEAGDRLALTGSHDGVAAARPEFVQRTTTASSPK